jgi:hypothetical protein
MEEQNLVLQDADSVSEEVTEWRRSDCCFAHVSQTVTVYEKSNAGEIAGVTFTCHSCENECATYTSPILARLQASAAGKEVEDDA